MGAGKKQCPDRLHSARQPKPWPLLCVFSGSSKLVSVNQVSKRSLMCQEDIMSVTRDAEPVQRATCHFCLGLGGFVSVSMLTECGGPGFGTGVIPV